MVIQSRMMMGIAAVIALGVAAWGSALALRPAHQGRVEVQQLKGSWAVEITELGASGIVGDAPARDAAR